MPITIYEGRRPVNESTIIDRRSERRFHDLAAAVRDHERSARMAGRGRSAQDDALYRRLRRICGE